MLRNLFLHSCYELITARNVSGLQNIAYYLGGLNVSCFPKLSFTGFCRDPTFLIGTDLENLLRSMQEDLKMIQ